MFGDKSAYESKPFFHGGPTSVSLGTSWELSLLDDDDSVTMAVVVESIPSEKLVGIMCRFKDAAQSTLTPFM